MILDGIVEATFGLYELIKGKLFSTLKVGNMYMVTRGDYAGQVFVYIEKSNDGYGFLSMPLMENRWVPKESFDFGTENGIIDFMERCPNYVRDICKIKFKENKEVH